MKITRSSKTSLKFLTEKKRQTLNVVMDEYSRLVNLFIEMFWGNEFAKKDLTKDITNLPHSWLSARMRQCAAREALGMTAGEKLSAKELNREASKPHHSGRKMILSAQIVTIENSHCSFDYWLVLTSIGRQLKINIPVKSHRHMNLFYNWNRSTTVTIHREYIQFSYEKETDKKLITGENVGIDVGINYLLATSQKELIGDQLKQQINRIKAKKQGSKKYKTAKKALSYYLHKIVKDYFTQHKNLRLVVVEKLNHLKRGKNKNRGKAFRKTLNNWNYRELLNLIEMRCEENRVSFRSVNPYKTSQTCPACSQVARENRSGEKFLCLRCGYEEHVDLVGAQNILERFISGRYGAAFKAL
ncbi:MAG: transposase [Bacteroidota bacterium]